MIENILLNIIDIDYREFSIIPNSSYSNLDNLNRKIYKINNSIFEIMI